MSDEEEEVWVVFNGEIYNFLEIREELQKKGYRFRGHSDTEVILYSFKEWGIDCLNRFRGMFALAIFDCRTGRLYLGRGRMGKKPLFYYSRDGHFAFASELKALMTYPFFRKEIDEQSLAEYLAFQYVPEPNCIFQNTFKLPPGHYLVMDGSGKIGVRKYWDFLDKRSCTSGSDHRGVNSTREGGGKESEEEVLLEFERLLTEAIRYRLISDVPLGAFLSGGIDSSTIVAIMQRISDAPVRTFTIGFEEKAYDEAPYAKAVAKHLGTDHHELCVKPKDIFELIPTLVDFYDEPFCDSSAIPTMLISRLARTKVTVVLSGDAGDELFCGYPRYQWLNKVSLVDIFPARLRKAIFGLTANLPFDRLQKISEGMQYESLLDVYRYAICVWKKPGLRSLLLRTPARRETGFERWFRLLSDENLLDRLMLIDMKTYLVDDILQKVDRASMAVSLEARVPLLDHHVVEFVLNLPLEYKWRRGEQKYLLKRLLYKYVPRKLFDRPKMGFGVPLTEWFRGELRYLLDVYLSRDRISRQGFFNPDTVSEYVQKHLSGRYNHYHRLWALIIFGMWWERYME
jgi:asparagine synthase (glutamine-hydrolysing)